MEETEGLTGGGTGDDIDGAGVCFLCGVFFVADPIDVSDSAGDPVRYACPPSASIADKKTILR